MSPSANMHPFQALVDKHCEENKQPAIEEAVRQGRTNGIPLGAVVAHPSCEFSYYLQKVVDGIAFLEVPADKLLAGQVPNKRFPVEEIFDVNVLYKIMQRMTSDVFCPQSSTH